MELENKGKVVANMDVSEDNFRAIVVTGGEGWSAQTGEASLNFRVDGEDDDEAHSVDKDMSVPMETQAVETQTQAGSSRAKRRRKEKDRRILVLQRSSHSPGRPQPRSKMSKIKRNLPDYSLRFKASLSSPKLARRGVVEPSGPPDRGIVVAMEANPRSATHRRAEKRPVAHVETLPGADAIVTVPRSKSLDGGLRRKRSARDRLEGDGAAKKSRIVDHRFTYKYDESEVPFLTNASACAQLVRSVKGGSSSSFGLDELLEVDAFVDVSKKLCLAMGAVNRLTNSYEHRIRQSGDEGSAKSLRDALAALDAEKGRADRAEEELVVERRKTAELEHALAQIQVKKAELESKLRSETARLRESRSKHVEAARNNALIDAVHVFQPRLDRIKKYTDEYAAAQKDLQLFVQIDGTLKCLRLLIDDGVAIPQGTVDHLEKDWAELDAKIKDIDVTDLEDEDWDAKTLFGIDDEDGNTVAPSMPETVSQSSRSSTCRASPSSPPLRFVGCG